MWSRKMRFSFVGAIIVALLAACGEDVLPPPEPITLRLGVLFSTYEMPPELAQALERFEQDNPHITVEVEGTFYLYEFFGGGGEDPLDVLLWVLYDVEPAGSGGAAGVLNLEPFVAADPESFGAEDFFPPLLDAFRWDGELYAVPAGADVAAMYYNRDLFDEQGVAYPQADWTWQDFLSTAQQMTTIEGEGAGQEGHWGFVCSPSSSYLFVLQNDGMMVDNLFNPTRPVLDDPRVPEALQWYADLALAHGVMPRPRDLARISLDTPGVFATGKAAMYLDSFGGAGGQIDGLPWAFRWGAAPLPRGVTEANWMIPFGYFISAQSLHPKEAWELALSLSKVNSLSLPARRGVAESGAFRQRVGSELADVGLAAFDSEVFVIEPVVFLGPPPGESRLNRFWATYADSAIGLTNGDITVEQMMARLQGAAANWPEEGQ